ncbi:MAG TPA: MMPL family transporter [Ilumatobacteraceae bacterium]|nr:MMPL family transporter [Ilumatobacteraceae bacterium]
MYIRIARWCFKHRVIVVVAWAIAFVVIQAVSSAVGTDFSQEFDSLGSESDRGFAVLREDFGGDGASYLKGTIVVRAEQGIDTPHVRGAVDQLLTEARGVEGIGVVGPFDAQANGQVSADGTIAFATLEGNEDLVTFNDTAALGKDLLDLGNNLETQIPGLQVEIGGQAFSQFEVPESEVIGIAFAIVILILAFGSVLAMGLPMAVALAGVGIGIALSNLASNITAMPEMAPIIATMIGLGVGIDYALFVVTRYREGLHDGFPPEAATAAAGDTATRAVVFAGLTVVVSLLGLLLIGLSFVAGLGVAAAITVAVTIAATVTLLPALLGFAKLRVELTRWRGLLAAGLVAVALLGVGLKVDVLLFAAPLGVLVLIAGLFVPVLKRPVKMPARKPVEQSIWYRWSHVIQRHPWKSLLAGVAILLLCAFPLLDLRLASTDEGNFPDDSTTRQAYDLLAEGFGPGFNSPLIVVAKVGSEADLSAFTSVVAAVKADPGVIDDGLPPFPNNPDNPTAAIAQVYSRTSPQSVETAELVERLRNDVVPAAEAATGGQVEAFVTGLVPADIDFSDYMSGRQLIFFGVVLAASFILLMIVFRSVLVPVKAVIMNLLSIAGAYGAVVALFQWGHFGSITGIAEGPIEPWAPMMLFAIVFGLSMDYEVFLLSRIREEYEHTGDAKNSVADGLASTARVITAAAAIMVVVFGSFILEDNRVSKLMGTGLAMAVLLDATVVRMLLVPATMELLGHKNWWIPKWLDRILPKLHVEGAPTHTDDIARIVAETEAETASAAESELEPIGAR